MRELKYAGRIMKRAPSDQSWSQMIRRLREGLSGNIILEPGDGTRYDLTIIMRSLSEVWVVRWVGGRPLGPPVYLPAWDAKEAAKLLSNGNEWSRTLLEWWLENLNAELPR